MTNPLPSHPQRATAYGRQKSVANTSGASTLPADGGRVRIWSFYWNVYVMVDKSDRAVLYTPERIAQMPVVWSRGA